MDKNAKIYVAGHRGLVGSAIVKALLAQGYTNLVVRTHAELDLTSEQAVMAFFAQEKPEYVFLAAAKVGGIHANNTYPAEFIHENLAIQTNVIHQSYVNGVKRLLFLGSSCIYPKNAPQPIKEEHLLTGPLEPTNRPYALAKIAGIEMCWSYNRQYGTQFLAAMPTNLYGPGDNYHPENSHVIPALIRKFHEGKTNNIKQVEIWGTGKPRREFLYSEDMATACLELMTMPKTKLNFLLTRDIPPLVNIGYGSDITISELAELIKKYTSFDGHVVYNTSKPDGTSNKLMDSTLAHTLGWRPLISIEEGLQLTIQDFLLKYAKEIH
ncbi:GDP-L-fucose synthase [Methylophilus sp. 14]|uniref:GDP-L-fucose synthase family protein n=1 Tax=Methylophilus sp. 14 TaxID=2781019 RepID=UPI00188F37FC|nr:GDP-L-fucose synthase [Methylophilus sp. 14]MBF4988676.1 GDP-L-fucose synthase [Methylophilus sp. 14]